MKLGPLVLTRDGALLWMLAGASLVAYLTAAAKPPTQWDYHAWLQFAAACFAWGVGKLQVSPSPSGAEVRRGVTTNGQTIEGTMPV